MNGFYLDIRLGMSNWNRNADFKRVARIKENKGDNQIREDFLLPSVGVNFGKELFYSFKTEIDYTFIFYTSGKIYAHLVEGGIRWTKYIWGTHFCYDLGFFSTIGFLTGGFDLEGSVDNIELSDGSHANLKKGATVKFPDYAVGGKVEVNLYYQFVPNFKVGTCMGYRYTNTIERISVDKKILSSDGKKTLIKNLYNDEVEDIKTDFNGPYFNLVMQFRI